MLLFAVGLVSALRIRPIARNAWPSERPSAPPDTLPSERDNVAASRGLGHAMVEE
jgi:hypothetical protein